MERINNILHGDLKPENILISSVEKNLETNWSCPRKLKRSVSQKDSLVIQRNLHNNILSLKCLETRSINEDNNDDNDNKIN